MVAHHVPSGGVIRIQNWWCASLNTAATGNSFPLSLPTSDSVVFWVAKLLHPRRFAKRVVMKSVVVTFQGTESCWAQAVDVCDCWQTWNFWLDIWFNSQWSFYCFQQYRWHYDTEKPYIICTFITHSDNVIWLIRLETVTRGISSPPSRMKELMTSHDWHQGGHRSVLKSSTSLLSKWSVVVIPV